MSALQDIFKCPLPRQERDETKSTNLNIASSKKKKKKDLCDFKQESKRTMVVRRETGATVFYLYCSTKSSMQPQTGNMPGGGCFDLPAGGRDPLAVKQHPLHPGSDLCIQ